MSKPTFKDMRKLLVKLILPFYEIERDLSLPIQNHRNENDAEHSWGLALMACALAPHIDAKLDVGKICQFAIVHDVVEIYAGDTSVWAPDEQLGTKAEREEAAVQSLAQDFGHFPWLIETVREYEQKDSQEALFVHALDKFIALLTLYEDKGYYYHKHKISRERFGKQFVTHRQKAHSHPGAAEYYEQLRAAFDAHPEYFYQNRPI